MTNLARYHAATRDIEGQDRRAFDAYLLGWLLDATDERTVTAALDATAAFVAELAMADTT